MFENILAEFKNLTTAVDFLTQDQAKEIISTLSKNVMEKLGAYTVDFLWKEKEKVKGGIFLRALFSESNKRGQINGHLVYPGAKGIWSKVYRDRQSVWIEDIQDKQCISSYEDGGTDKILGRGFIKLTEAVENKIGGGTVEIDDLELYKDTDVIISIPIIYRDAILGIYSIELEKFQKKVEDKTYGEIFDLTSEMAHLMWKADAQRDYIEDTKKAINNFNKSLVTPSLSIVLNPVRIGFMLRPFEGEEFNYVEVGINKYLHTKEVHVAHYFHPPGGGIVISNLMEEIKRAHFGIADMTGNRPNSLLELGMMMILDKKIIILKRKDDDKELPFDIGAYNYYRYEMRGTDLVFFEPATNDPLQIDNVLAPFVEALLQDKSFREAQPYTT